MSTPGAPPPIPPEGPSQAPLEAPPQPPIDPKLVEARATAAFFALLRALSPRVLVVPTIVALNVGVWVVMVARGVSWTSPETERLLAWGANFGPRTLNGEPWRLLTAAFLHAGALHLGMNMLALWSAGALIERLFGSLRLAVIYLAAAVAGGLASVAIHPQTVSVGASGAVFGLYGALGGFLLRERGSIPAPVLSRLGRVAGSFVVYNIIFGFSIRMIDNSAHVGGLVGGAVAGFALARPLVARRGPSLAAPALALLVTGALAALAVAKLPKPPDVEGTFARFVAAETTLNARYNDLAERNRRGELSEADAAAEIERDVLPPWREARRGLELPGRWTPEARAFLERIDRYAAARERLWTLVAQSIEHPDPAQAAQIEAAAAEVKRLSDDIAKPHGDASDKASDDGPKSP